LVGVFGAIIAGAMLPVLHPRQHLPLGRAITLHLGRDAHPWHVRQALEEVAEEGLGRVRVPATLRQNIEPVSVLIHRPPERVPLLVDGDEYRIEVPLSPRPRAPTSELMRVLLATRAAPRADRLIGHEDRTHEPQRFDVAVAQTEAGVEPHTMAEDVDRKAVLLVTLSVGGPGHTGSLFIYRPMDHAGGIAEMYDELLVQK
jgi:hypothetical protein